MYVDQRTNICISATTVLQRQDARCSRIVGYAVDKSALNFGDGRETRDNGRYVQIAK
jgi:hypothetical protein